MLEAILIVTTIQTNSPLLEQQIPATVIAEPAPPPEPSLDDKIKTNYYTCNTDTQWIRADTAECLNKPAAAPKRAESPKTTAPTQKPASTAQNAPSGWFPRGQCTFWVWSNRPVGKWNNASQWKHQAARDGWTVSSRPVVGAIAWQSNHVALVESIKGDEVTVSEMNFKGWNVVSRRSVPISTFSYIY